MKKNKKILLMVSSMQSGGAERVASTLANAWVSRGDQVILMPTFSGRGECFYQLFSGVRLVYLADLVSIHAHRAVNVFVRLRALRRFIVAERPDVLVSFLSNVNVGVVVASIGLRIPIIICEHTDPFVKPSPTSLLFRFVCRIFYPLADALVVLTQSVASKYDSWGWLLHRIWVIPNPISEQMMNIQHSNSESKKIRRILGIGRLVEEKQFCVLIRVFAKLAKYHANWCLRIAGEGPVMATLKQQITDLGLDSRVEMLGLVSSIDKELINSDVFVSTSRHEGFPMGLLEAMAAGLPCVTFDCQSGPREITMDGQLALLVPLNDEHALGTALERIMTDADLRESLGRRAKVSVIERFAVDKILEHWDLLFKEVGIMGYAK